MFLFEMLSIVFHLAPNYAAELFGYIKTAVDPKVAKQVFLSLCEFSFYLHYTVTIDFDVVSVSSNFVIHIYPAGAF